MVATYSGDVEIKRTGNVIRASFSGVDQEWNFDYRLCTREEGLYLDGISRGGKYFPRGISDDVADEMELRAEQFTIPNVLAYLAEEHSDVVVYIDEATRNLLNGNKERRSHTIRNHQVVSD